MKLSVVDLNIYANTDKINEYVFKTFIRILLTRGDYVKLIIVDNYEFMSKKAAQILSSQIILKPNSVLGLATGSTPEGMYEILVKMYQEEGLDFSNITTFNLDEYYMINPNNKQSYNYFMHEKLFNSVNVLPENINMLNGMTNNIEHECTSYEEKISKCGGIDLQVLGVGKNGHIGFNEPDFKFEAITHLVELDEETIEANSRFFNNKEEVPTKALSMGMKTIMNSRKIILLANGEEKAEAIKQAVQGSIMPETPVSILQLHPDVTIIVDKEAAKLINEE